MAIKVTAAGYTAFFQTKQRFVKEVIKNIDDRFSADSMIILDALGNGYKCCWTAMERKTNGRNGPVPAVIDKQATWFEWEQLHNFITLN